MSVGVIHCAFVAAIFLLSFFYEMYPLSSRASTPSIAAIVGGIFPIVRYLLWFAFSKSTLTKDNVLVWRFIFDMSVVIGITISMFVVKKTKFDRFSLLGVSLILSGILLIGRGWLL